MAASSHDRSPAMAEPTPRIAGETASDTVARWEQRLQQAALVLARLSVAYLFFTQLWWKAPPTYGCPADFHFTTGTPAQLQRSGGLCDWIGIESVYASTSLRRTYRPRERGSRCSRRCARMYRARSAEGVSQETPGRYE